MNPIAKMLKMSLRQWRKVMVNWRINFLREFKLPQIKILNFFLDLWNQKCKTVIIYSKTRKLPKKQQTSLETKPMISKKFIVMDVSYKSL